jgi:hypothetical protein
MLAPVTPATYTLLGGAWIGVAVAVFVTLLFVSAPYGRHRRAGWGPAVPARRAWTLMEAPAPLVVGLALALGPRRLDGYSLLLGGLFLAHYANRALVFPLRLPRTSQPMPLSIVASACGFNVINGWFLGLWLGVLAPAGLSIRLADARVAIGFALFLLGAAVNLRSDVVLRGLRPAGTGGYRVPTGGLFRLVSCPNYLGEIVEWTGFALIMWALPGWAFLVWTAANLVPRALAHHRWYRATFPDYPPTRRALVPFLL